MAASVTSWLCAARLARDWDRSLRMAGANDGISDSVGSMKAPSDNAPAEERSVPGWPGTLAADGCPCDSGADLAASERPTSRASTATTHSAPTVTAIRSEERRVGKEWR